MEATESIFTEVMGSSPYVKVLGFFITFDRFDYSKSQVADDIGISRVTIEKIWSSLIEKKMIVRSRQIGRAEMYRLNTSDPSVKILQDASFKLATAYAAAQAVAGKRQKTSAARMPLKVRA